MRSVRPQEPCVSMFPPTLPPGATPLVFLAKAVCEFPSAEPLATLHGVHVSTPAPPLGAPQERLSARGETQ